MKGLNILIIVSALISLPTFAKKRKVASDHIAYYSCDFKRSLKFEPPAHMQAFGKDHLGSFQFPSPGKREGQDKKVKAGNNYRMFGYELILDSEGKAVLKIDENDYGLIQDLEFQVKKYDDVEPPEIQYTGLLEIQERGQIEYELRCSAS